VPRGVNIHLKLNRVSSPIRSFVVTVDEINKRTGINIFPKLEDGVKNQIEGWCIMGMKLVINLTMK
jgi:DNA/RNA endonuclease G (NUC1)